MESRKGKKNQAKTIRKEEQLDSEQNQMMKDLEQFNSDKSWSELDELEQHLFNGSHEQSSPDDMPVKIRRKDRRKQKEEEIAQYEEALKAIQQENKIFIPLSKPPKLNINTPQYLEMIREAIDKDSNSTGVARMLGIKTQSILPKDALKQHFQLVASYLKEKVVPKKLEDEYCSLLSTQENNFLSQATD